MMDSIVFCGGLTMTMVTVVTMVIKEGYGYDVTRPYTRLSQSRAVGQGQ